MKHHDIYFVTGPVVYSGKDFASETGNDTKMGSSNGIMAAEVHTMHFERFALEDIDLVQEEDD
jgi:hypothetical protein